ncbi:MAG: PTS lactose/cellobiose transporter subunit IIA [Lachnospiraceae bacterium]|nr:PTS lactose/cellobiose transporter subunit IIA [Lachnospiraceae bacterium]
MDNMEDILLGIISNVGTTRSYYIEAIYEVKDGNFEKYDECMAAGEKAFTEGHHFHSELICKEASGEKMGNSLLLVHAEDQLMSAEAFQVLAEEFADMYKKIYNL